MVITLNNEIWMERYEYSIVQVDNQTEEQYNSYILKYRSRDLIICILWMVCYYRGYYLDFMKLMRNVRSLVLGLMVIENKVLSTPEKCECWRVCDTYTLNWT